MRTLLRHIVMVMLLGIVTGCASSKNNYQPPLGNPSELSQIKTAGSSGIESIDDKRVMSIWRLSQMGPYPEDVVTLTPGKHQVHAVASGYQFPPPHMWLWVVAQPGKTYILKDEASKAEGGGFHVRFWLEDIASGKPVGGVVGSDDEPAK